LLVANLKYCKPNFALEIVLGDGGLLYAAKRRWNDISLIGVDLDNANVSSANKNNEIEAHLSDGFNPDLPEFISGVTHKLKSVVLSRFQILFPEEPSHHHKAVIEGPKRLTHKD
jgi:hypothetical protein